ncbi:F-box domain-containing protein [Mycena chlorophos]|uniref:F-box domain-containing protein n=1 Tax=Mycena chlorophos TaxID=658473 RepID=A0A8H6W329_MYCCL|nr:F-box domain-containing protein [Mycena chlorophos]
MSATSKRIAVIDDELRQLHARIAVLTAERNTLTALHRMPNEILARIFALLPGLPSDGVMHVCRRWHLLCVGLAELWADIRLESWTPGRFAEALKRSGSRLLHVEIACVDIPGASNAAAAQAVMSVLFKHAARIESLTGVLGSDGTQKLLTAMHPVSFPALKLLSLEKSNPLLGRYDDGLDDDDYSSLDGMSDDSDDDLSHSYHRRRVILSQLPLLEVLVLRQVRLDAELAVLSTLTSLHLANVAPFPVADLITLLHSTPNLRTLTLENATRIGFSGQDPTGIAPLPHLQTLHIRQADEEVATILQHIDVPASATVSIRRIALLGISNEHSARTLAWLGTHTRNAPHADTLRLYTDRPSFRYGLDNKFTETQAAGAVVVSLSSAEGTAESSRIANAVLRALAPPHLASITRLECTGVELSASVWKALLAQQIVPSNTIQHITINADMAGKRLVQGLSASKKFAALRELVVLIPVKPASTYGVADIAKAIGDFAAMYQ